MVEIVDTVENVDRLLPTLDDMVSDGMVTTERVHIVAYRSSRGGEPSA